MSSHEKISANFDANYEPNAGSSTNDAMIRNPSKTPAVTYPPQIVARDSFNQAVQSINDESDPLLQLDNIHTLSTMLKYTHLSEDMAKQLFSDLNTVISKGGNTPLVEMSLEYLKTCIDVDYLHGDREKVKISKYYIDDLLQKKQLHKDYPALPGFSLVTRIAPNIACTINNYGDIEYTAFRGANTTIQENKDPSKDPFTKLLNYGVPLWVFNFAHDIRFRGMIEEKIGSNLADVSLEAQIQLLKFMTEADSKRFDKLCSVLSKANQKLRIKLIENFVAADFGEDFGDALLDIANSERLSNNEKERVLDTISSCRESVGRITDLYTGFDDGKFAKEYARASNERLTDAVTVFQQIAKKGVAKADLDWAGKPRFDYNKAIEALEYEAKSLEIISGTLGDVKSGVKGSFAEVVLTRDKSLQRLNRTFYNFYSPQHGYVLLYTRSEGSHSFDPTIEFGKERSKYSEDSINAGVEASISLTTNPIDPFSLPNPYRPDKRAVRNLRFYDPIRMNKVSAIRLDREGRAPGEAADSTERDPINPIGMVSVDLAAIGDREDTPSGKIARLLSVGGKLREEAHGATAYLNHNTRWFDQDAYGTARGFSELVDYIDKMAQKMCSENGPDNAAESFSRLMKQSRGKKARQAA